MRHFVLNFMFKQGTVGHKTKGLRPRPASFGVETETHKNWSRVCAAGMFG